MNHREGQRAGSRATFMKTMTLLALMSFILNGLILFPESHACTHICLKPGEEIVLGYNYDWFFYDAFIIINKRDVQKMALVTGAGRPARWISRYGSVTFNQYGKEFPNGGMNEKGLVICPAWLDDTEYPSRDSGATLNELQWIQYQLDNHGSVDEVIKSDSAVFIVPVFANLRYFVVDASGKTAIIEFLNGKMVVHSGEALPHGVGTNSTYARSVKYLENPNRLQSAPKWSSLNRFKTAAELLKKYYFDESRPGLNAVDYAFNVLSEVSTGITRWTIVFDLKKLRISYRTSEQKPIKEIDLSSFNFDPNTAVQTIDMNNFYSGDISGRFHDYSPELNRNLIMKTCRKLGLAFTDEELEALSRYQWTLESSGSPVQSFEKTGKLVVSVTGTKDDIGDVELVLFNSRENFEKMCPVRMGEVSVLDGIARWVVYNLPFGEYAITAYHDENGNMKIDRGVFGIPKEPLGFSNNVRIFFKMPRFEKVKFDLNSKEKTIHIRLK
ncbi:MAG: DUF2141 domain-containing protein [Acidobacteriota bacterium]